MGCAMKVPKSDDTAELPGGLQCPPTSVMRRQAIAPGNGFLCETAVTTFEPAAACIAW